MSLKKEDAPRDPEIGYSDITQPFAPKPLIADILRTRYCIPGSLFLVEGIDTVIPVHSRHRAVRLLLGDGELCIQALLHAETHGFVDSGQVYEGCYVRVGDFELKVTAVAGLWEDVEDLEVADPEIRAAKEAERRRSRKKARGMVYLLVKNLATIGWNNTYMKILEDQTGVPTARNETQKASPTELTKEGDPALQHQLLQPAAAANVRNAQFDGDSDIDDAFEHMDVSLPKATQRRQELETRQSLPRPRPANGILRRDNAHLPWSSNDPSQPLKLTQLRSIPNLPYKQNWTVNVLAIVQSISELEPSHLPPYQQRSARLVDPTTNKHVLLTVFLDPETFSPRVGSVVLLLGVKNHPYAGGCLNKYASDRPRGGTSWWFEDPQELDWCDVAGLKKWWEERNEV